MRRVRAILCVVVLVLLPYAAPAETFLCTGEQATGFRFSNDKWRLANFEPSFVVSRSSGEDGFKWDVRESGADSGDTPAMGCEYDFNTYGYLDCGGVGDFKMNRRNMRFIYTLAFGYVNQGVAPGSGSLDEQVLIAIGTCAPAH